MKSPSVSSRLPVRSRELKRVPFSCSGIFVVDRLATVQRTRHVRATLGDFAQPATVGRCGGNSAPARLPRGNP